MDKVIINLNYFSFFPDNLLDLNEIPYFSKHTHTRIFGIKTSVKNSQEQFQLFSLSQFCTKPEKQISFYGLQRSLTIKVSLSVSRKPTQFQPQLERKVS